MSGVVLSVSKGDAPDCLSRYSRYEDLRGSPCQQEVRARLSAEQDGYCAYCERLFSESAHSRLSVEHVKPRSAYPAYQIEWCNLIGSCSHKDTCNHHKGNQYAEQFINPVDERPSDFMELLPLTGDISPRESLCDRCRGRAEYTVAVLNLNQTRLRQARRSACRAVRQASMGGVLPEVDLQEVLGRADFVPMMREVFGTAAELKDDPHCSGCGR